MSYLSTVVALGMCHPIVDTLVVFRSMLEPVAIFELEFTFSAGWIIMLRFYNRVIFTRVTWFLGVSSCT